MRPALSIVFFTTLSGAGYGLWVLIALAVAIGAAPPDRFAIVVALLAGLVLTSIGLLASVAHLGKPLRAWRALSQWRSSWLSREGILALACVPLCLLLAWRVESVHSGLRIRVGFAVFALLATATVICTARIYASLRTIRAWRDWRVTPLYGLLALHSGALWLWLLWEITARPHGVDTGVLAGKSAWLVALLVVIVLTWALQRAYWRRPDEAVPDTAAATGLGRPGTVTAMEPPHTEENYLLREMGFAVARRHAERLRAIASRALFALPLLAIGVALLLPDWALPAAIVAPAAAMVGVFVQRWLFFAEARHTVQAYYR